MPLLLAHAPAAVELVDRIILDLTRGNRDLARARGFLDGDPDAILVTEFHAESEAELRDRLRALASELERAGVGYGHLPRVTAGEKKQVWDIRKGGLGLLMGMKGAAKPVGFVEDTAVPVEHLSAFMRRFRHILSGFGHEACYYGHASVGCLHVRPIMNLKSESDRRHLREISSAVADLVAEYGGAMSAEHGDGLARSEWQERMFGPVLYGAFRELKQAFDPHGIRQRAWTSGLATGVITRYGRSQRPMSQPRFGQQGSRLGATDPAYQDSHSCGRGRATAKALIPWTLAGPREAVTHAQRLPRQG